MPTTRSASGRLSSTNTVTTTVSKRKASTSMKSPAKKPKSNATISTRSYAGGILDSEASALVPAQLSFSFEEGKQHLISVDDRFHDLFTRLACRPFEHLEPVHPFRALAVSILGQQISWHAARSITHRFKRLYDQSLPETWKEYTSTWLAASFFPSPQQVAETDVATLRTAGLSLRKAEYVKDLAERFADGRLSTEKLVSADDEQLAEMLTAVRGIGKWTVDMFALFSLRRPDILPTGDLGVQRGLVRWFLSLHSSTYSYSISPQKIDQGKEQVVEAANDKDEGGLPMFSKAGPPEVTKQTDARRAASPDVSSIPPIGDVETDENERGVPSMPPPFTPSIERTLRGMRRESSKTAATAPPPLPAGLTVAVLKSRLEGKKKIKGAFLTPKEMEELTDIWRPYRSLGVYYMWSLADPPVS